MKKCNQKGCCCDKIIIEINKVPDDIEKEWWEVRGCTVKGNLVLIPFKCPELRGNNKCWIYDKRPLACRIYPLIGSKKKLEAFGVDCSLL